MIIYLYHADTGAYLGEAVANESPLEPGEFLLPAFATFDAPPAAGEREIACFVDDLWTVRPDWRGVPLWDTASGEAVTSARPGVTLDEIGATDLPRPSAAHTWQDGGWVLDEAIAVQQLATARAVLGERIDSRAAAIYTRWTRFEAEYRAREAAAQAYKDADYQGEPGLYVVNFAEPAGLTARAAADAILAQATGLRSAQDELAALRMRKYEVARAADIDAADALTVEITSAMDKIARGIG